MLDSQSGLYYFHARYYDPAIGRFLSVDPAQDGDNWWVYCGNKPLVHMDLYGLFAVPNSVQMNFYYASATVKPGKLFNPAYFAQLAESFGPQTIHGSPYGLPRGLDRGTAGGGLFESRRGFGSPPHAGLDLVVKPFQYLGAPGDCVASFHWRHKYYVGVFYMDNKYKGGLINVHILYIKDLADGFKANGQKYVLKMGQIFARAEDMNVIYQNSASYMTGHIHVAITPRYTHFWLLDKWNMWRSWINPIEAIDFFGRDNLGWSNIPPNFQTLGKPANPKTMPW